MKKQIMVGLLVAMMAISMMTNGLCVSAIASENENESITICFGVETRGNGENSFNAENVKAFFERNELDYSFYRNWMYTQELTNLETVTFSVSKTRNMPQANANMQIQNRIVYADRNYYYPGKENPFTVGKLMRNVVREAITLTIGKYSQIIASLCSIFDITDPNTYFGTDVVREGKEYYVNDGASRVVTKFVELYAPVSGQVKWYPWGYAEGDYVRHGVELFYKGAPVESKKDLYRQYYTEHYYHESTLISLTEQAYARGQNYAEVADDYAASVGGYGLYTRPITKTMYYEYDDKI